MSDGERWGAADEASLARPPLTSCCAARFLTGHRPVPVRGPGVGDPCSRPLPSLSLFSCARLVFLKQHSGCIIHSFAAKSNALVVLFLWWVDICTHM